ncbi:TfoX/Sxy family protein [Pelomonas sp. CA6]|uniref:TfoX/Sxy family protein n=1 Tax=Pelomonas sp. CA6 TaxID=2907999 RepID=UPI001F4C471C|nr:TfoX/Sxy family protein [Pelomonas sp. CA6]MCH7343084.1 TfoX/Sxy family protein [Pelomonas sp. CA6]
MPHDFIDHCLELLGGIAHAGPLRARRMFGGHGIYADDLFIAIVSDEQLYLKADASTLPRFEQAGCAPFRYPRRQPDGSVAMARLVYYQPPEDAMESAALMLPWARMAVEAALRAANAKAVKRPRDAKRKPVKRKSGKME